MTSDTLRQIANNFEKELRDSQAGQTTSLPFIINELPTNPLVQDGETFQVMGLGGSIFRTALITKSASDLEVHPPLERSHPAFATKEIFLQFITENLDPNTKYLAINLAQALGPVFEKGRLDGTLEGNAKEHRFEGLMHEKVAAAVEQYVKEKTGRDIVVSIANDTICLMLSGLTKYPAENLAAGIVGTGMNFAIFVDATHAVNLEASDFKKFDPNPQTKIIDAQSERPDFHVWEKEVAGAYLFTHFNLLLKERGISYPEIQDTKELDTVARQNIEGASDLAKEVLNTSAEEVAAMMAGIQNFYGKDVTFVMQGSLFWHGYNYKEKVEETMLTLSDFKPTFVEVEHADYLGAAKLIA